MSLKTPSTDYELMEVEQMTEEEQLQRTCDIVKLNLYRSLQPMLDALNHPNPEEYTHRLYKRLCYELEQKLVESPAAFFETLLERP